MKEHNTKKLIIIFSLFVLPWITSCDIENPFLKEKKSEGYLNQSPETYLFLFFKSDTFTVQDTLSDGEEPVIVTDTIITTLDTTSSCQVLHWWGEDPDGEVIGYYYKWNYDDSLTFTAAESETFFVPIRQRYDLFDFQVQAVDDDSLADPTPAKLTFPVYNTPPHIEFRLKSNPSAPPGNPNVTSYTFPTRTFVWDASDADGNQTITRILWALNDTSNWNIIEKDEYGVLPDRITLTELELGEHIFFAKAQDVAMAESNLIMFPDTTDDEVPNHWVVKPVLGNVLLVDDFAQDQINKTTQRFYTDILRQVLSDTFSIWEIGSSTKKEGQMPVNMENAIPYTLTDIEATFSYFDKVIWFSHMGRTHLTEAGLAITRYVKKGGKIFITNGNEVYPDTTWTFTDLDSVFRLNPGGRLLTGVEIWADFGDDELNNELTLEIGQLIGNRVSALIPGKTQGTSVVYVMEHPDSTDIPVPYSGTPSVGVKYKPEFIEGESIYFSLPLHYCDGRENVKELLGYILNKEFEN
jgi:hypothetical protein